MIEEYKKLKTREEKEKMLKKMSDEDIDKLIKETSNMYGKIWLKSFKGGKNE